MREIMLNFDKKIYKYEYKLALIYTEGLGSKIWNGHFYYYPLKAKSIKMSWNPEVRPVLFEAVIISDSPFHVVLRDGTSSENLYSHRDGKIEAINVHYPLYDKNRIEISVVCHIHYEECANMYDPTLTYFIKGDMDSHLPYAALLCGLILILLFKFFELFKPSSNNK